MDVQLQSVGGLIASPKRNRTFQRSLNSFQKPELSFLNQSQLSHFFKKKIVIQKMFNNVFDLFNKIKSGDLDSRENMVECLKMFKLDEVWEFKDPPGILAIFIFNTGDQV